MSWIPEEKVIGGDGGDGCNGGGAGAGLDM